LERALVSQFRHRYWQIPLCNESLKNKKWNEGLEKLFKPDHITKVLASFEWGGCLFASQRRRNLTRYRHAIRPRTLRHCVLCVRLFRRGTATAR